MPITDPAEEYFKDGLWGWVTDAWEKIAANASNALHVHLASQAADIEVKQTEPADLTPGVHGYDGSDWKKLALLWGYSDVYSEAEDNTNANVGSNDLTFSAVPSGYVRVITNIVAWNAVTAASYIWITPTIDSASVTIIGTLYQAVTRYADWQGYCVLGAGDYLVVTFSACVAGDTIRARAVGYDMAVS